MPPRFKLPPKKSKNSKAPPIDFTSTATATASAPQFSSRDDWLNEGVRQEEQGDRYQHGAKAARHFSNAVVAYRIAGANFDFDPTYNAARVLYQLATAHLPAPDCVQALEEAVEGYRTAVSTAQNEDEKIDSLFNLAQALVALQGMQDDRAAGTSTLGAKSHLLEAKQLFEQVEGLQRTAMERNFSTNQLGAGEEDAGMDEDDQGSTTGSEAGVQTANATEGRIVTPQLVLDTVLELAEVDVSLYSTSPTPESNILEALAESASAAISRAFDLRRVIPTNTPGVDLDLSLAQLSFVSTCAPHIPPTSPHILGQPQITSTYTTLLSSHPNNATLISSYADHLYDSLSLSPLSSTALETLSTANEIYTKVYTLLSNRLSPPKDVPTHAVPSLLSANLASRAEVLLLAHHLAGTSSPTPTFLQQARDLALEAILISGAGFRINLSDEGTLRATKTSVEGGRTDWTTTKAFREAFFLLLRIRMREEARTVAGEGIEFWQKMSGRGGTVDLEWYVEECRGDKVWEASGGVEEKGWEQVLQRLSS